MATRKPSPETRHARHIAEELEQLSKEQLPVLADEVPKFKDGAEKEAYELMLIATSMGHYSWDEKRKMIAARLRKIAQGPRKWGPLR